jgi:signal transduction histidine kinase/BarA-like signal transduction histidine kinase
VYNPLSGICIKKGETFKAMELAEKAISIKKDTGDLRGLAFAIYGRGKVYSAMGYFEEAERDYIEALGIHNNMGERLGLAMVYQKLGIMYVRSGQHKKAEEMLLRGVRFSVEYNLAVIKFKCLQSLYELHKALGDPEKSLKYLEEYLREKEGVINTQTMKVIENYELITQVERMEKDAQMQKEKAEIMAKMIRAEQSAQVKQEFLSAMSHEIRTPLNAVLTIAGMLPERKNTEDQKLLDCLRSSANNLLYIVNDIFDFTQLDSGKVKLEPRQVNLYPFVEKIKNTYAGQAENKNIRLELMVDEEAQNVYEIDDVKIGQVLGNLISNAIKYTEQGEVDIEVELRKPFSGQHTLRFIVKDTGIGIPEEYRESIFESFSMDCNITKRRAGGTGLGLAIVKKILQLYGSEIHVNSAQGSGSIFYFDLNLTKVEKIASKDETATPPSLNGKKVLLAEDNPMNAFVATKLLSTWGMEITHVKNGTEAIQEASVKEYDYILMDIHMPEMNGYEATEHIRTHENPNRGTPIFALTADITAMQEERYVSYFNHFLWKPLEVNKLFEAMSGMLLEAA